jgi:hypothetical protein
MSLSQHKLSRAPHDALWHPQHFMILDATARQPFDGSLLFGPRKADSQQPVCDKETP